MSEDEIKRMKLRPYADARLRDIDEVWKKAIPRRLKMARRRLGWSQIKLAEETGLKEITIQYYEQGRMVPGVTALRRISVVTGFSMEWLMGASQSAVRFEVKEGD